MLKNIIKFNSFVWKAILIASFSSFLVACSEDKIVLETIGPDSGGPDSGVITDPIVTTERRMTIDGNKVKYFSNYSIEASSDDYYRAIIVIHGTGRNSDDYYNYAKTAITAEDMTNNTLLFAPKFQTLDDDPASDEHYWKSSGWKKGSKAKNGNRTSSFAIIDDMLTKISTSFPNVTKITIVGHSAGGQFVQRYAALNNIEQTLRININVYYVVANPSSFVYPTNYRPGSTSSCSNFDKYKYGLENMPSYMHYTNTKYQTNEPIIENLLSRSVYILLGTTDTTDAHSLDTSCEGNAQGPHRYARGVSYFNHVKSLRANVNHTKIDIQGVGHSSNDMFNSLKGRRTILQLN
jgi:hypothetical protein